MDWIHLAQDVVGSGRHGNVSLVSKCGEILDWLIVLLASQEDLVSRSKLHVSSAQSHWSSLNVFV
jgi:hypothetical protein